MKRCLNCNINIIDDSDHCPFCRCVVKNEQTLDDKHLGIGGYPDAVAWVRKYRFIGNLVLFLSIVASFACVFINLMISTEVLWSVIVVLGLIYGNVILQYAIMGKSGYRNKVFLLTILGLAVLTGIDALTGYHAWSINYVLPGAIIFLDVATLIVMFINFRNWQSYLIIMILEILLSIGVYILYLVNIINSPYLVNIALALSILIFLGTFILGDRRAQSELKRRFHI